MLTGAEYFYNDWKDLVLRAVTAGPVLDLGTSEPFRKEMGILQGNCPEPYFCLDLSHSDGIALVGNGENLPLRDESIGTVLCSHVLEHVTDPGRVMSEIHRVLRPSGRAYLTFLDIWPYHSGAYGDYHRFKQDAIDLYLAEWSGFRSVTGGGPVQVILNYFHETHPVRRLGQHVANWVDPRFGSRNTTPVRYVVAVK